MNTRSIISVISLAVLFFLPCAAGETSPVDIGINEKLGKSLPMSLEFMDEKGYLVRLSDVIHKPTIINFVYFRCPGICSPILTELTSVVNKLDLVPGKDYQVVTVSFDHREKFDLAAAKKTSYFGLIEKSIPDSSWKFLTGDSTTIHQLTDAAGFMFKKEGNDFVHPGALILVSPEGKISRYLYGTQYLPFDVKMAIGEASEGRTGPTIIRLLQMCYSYNPEGRTYVFNITRVAGAAILFCAFIFVIVISIKKKSV